MNIDISNAHCGPRIQFPDHAWLRVVFITRNCLRSFLFAYERTLDARPVARDDAPATRGERPSSLGVVRNEPRERFFHSHIPFGRCRRRPETLTRLAELRVKTERTHEERERDRSCARADRVSSESMRNSVSRARETGRDRHASSCTPPPSFLSPCERSLRRFRTTCFGTETSRLVTFVRELPS